MVVAGKATQIREPSLIAIAPKKRAVERIMTESRHEVLLVDDDADIGANTCIDRAFLGATRIGKGVKLDNLIQVAHNVEIKAHTVIAAQTGISGSTTIGSGVMMGGQVGTVGHIEIGDGAKVGAQSGVSKDVNPGETVFGYPARSIMKTMRIDAALNRLPDTVKKVSQMEKIIAELQKDKSE